jgi:aryl-alcohol dehydrogenase-like predicted oxidoreductase
MFEEVSCVIPGASRPEQLLQNIEAVDEHPLSDDQMQKIKEIYTKRIKHSVHQLW